MFVHDCEPPSAMFTDVPVLTPSVTGPAPALTVIPPVPIVSVRVAAVPVIEVVPVFANVRPPIDWSALSRTTTMPFTLDWSKTASSFAPGAVPGAVPPDVGLSDQFETVVQRPAVVVFHHHVAASTGRGRQRHSRTASAARRHRRAAGFTPRESPDSADVEQALIRFRDP